MSNDPRLNRFTFMHKGVVAALWITITATLVNLKKLPEPLASELMTYAPGLLGRPAEAIPTMEALGKQLVRLTQEVQDIFSVGARIRKGDIAQQEIIEGAAALKLLNGFCQTLHINEFYSRAGLVNLPKITLRDAKELDEALDALAGQSLPGPLRHL